MRDFTFTIGAAVTRNQGFVTFSGEGSDARVTGSYLLHDRQHCDTRLVIDHAVPRCTSREIFKCVVDEEARGIFQGKVIVRPCAEDRRQAVEPCAAAQPDGRVRCQAELEIFADDVICGHGATAGDLEGGSRLLSEVPRHPGGPRQELLITAFTAEAFDDVTDERLRDGLAARAEGWLDRQRRTADAAGMDSDG